MAVDVEHGGSVPTRHPDGTGGNHVLHGIAPSGKETFDDEAERATFNIEAKHVGRAGLQAGGTAPGMYLANVAGVGLDKWLGPFHDQAHALGGSDHTAATLAELNALVSDATLDDATAPRTPTAHAAGHATGQPDAMSVADIGGYTTAQVDTLIDPTLKAPEAFAAAGTYPVTYDGNAVQKGDSFRITGAGTMGAVTVNVEDLLIALVDTPAQVDANWMVVESNRDQATETVKGVAEIATQPEADAGTDNLRIITALTLANFPGLGKFPLPVLAPGTAMVANTIRQVSATGAITFPNAPPENTLCGMLTVTAGERTVDASAEGALIVDPVGGGMAIADVQAYPNQNIFLTIWQYTTAPGIAAWMIVAQSPLLRFQPFELPSPTPVAAVLQLGRTNVYDVLNHTSLLFPAPGTVEDGAELITKSQAGTAGSSITLDGNGSDIENPSTGAVAGTAPTLGTTGEHHHWKRVAAEAAWTLIG